jgi:O-antigen/teichoic acid export membrane protein
LTLKRNIIASYVSQFYVTAVGIVTVPIYVQYIGAEAYGLVGFFTMLQAWFSILDMGLSHTIARESARFNGGAIKLLDYRRLARALEGLFFVLAVVGGTSLFLLAQPIGAQWLNASLLPVSELTQSLQIMAMIVALRWMCGLYRGIIIGAERLVWLSGFNSLIATARFILILPVLIYVSATPVAFFVFQLAVALLEFSGLTFMAYRLLPVIPLGDRILWSWRPIKPIIKFSFSIAFSSVVWVMITQIDKLLLSYLLSLEDYGIFTLAVVAAGGLIVIATPVGQVLIPRMSKLSAEKNERALIKLYTNASQFVACVIFPAMFTIVLYSEEILTIWTSNSELAVKSSPIFILYAIGNGVLALGAFPYYLQFSKGDLRLHTIGNIIFFIAIVPTSFYAAKIFGAIGAGYVWLIFQILYFVLWTPLVHKKFIKGMHGEWLKNILKIMLLSLVVIYILSNIFTISASKFIRLFEIIVVYFIAMFTALMSIKSIRENLAFFLKKKNNSI